MIQHAWTVLCTKCIVDPESKNATLVEVIEQLNVPTPPKFPVIVPVQFDLVTTWYRGDPNVGERGTSRLSLQMPDGTVTQPQEYVIDLTEFGRNRTITRSGGISINAGGIYYFRVEVRDDGAANWRTAAAVPMLVALIQAEQVQPAEAQPQLARPV